MNNNHIYMKTLRIGAAFVALSFWWVSVQFSVVGFGITLPKMAWIGWVLAFGITILQLIFNRGVYNNPTLFFMGILAYIYGVTTNILGIMRAQQIVDSILVDFSDNLGFYLPRVIIAFVLAMAIEIVPEALILWAIFLDSPIGDFISSIFKGTNLSKKASKSVPKGRPSVPDMSGTEKNRTNYGRNVPDKTNFVPDRTNFVPDRTPHGQDGNADERTVISYCNNHFRKHGNLPAVRKVEHDTGVTKTKVAEIMKPLRKKWK